MATPKKSRIRRRGRSMAVAATASGRTRARPPARHRPLPTPDWLRLLADWPGVVFRQRPDFTFEFVTPGMEALTGVPLEAWRGTPPVFWETVHEQDAERLRRQIRASSQLPEGMHTHYRIRHLKTGRLGYIAEYRRPLRGPDGGLTGYDGYWVDATRQTIAEKLVAKAAWKETLAVITISLAHDFNNIIAGISSFSDLFLGQLSPGHPFHEGLNLISQNARQAAQLVQRIVRLHEDKTGSRSYHDLNTLVMEAVDLLRKVIPRHIEIGTKRAAESLPLYVDEVEFRQVVINLALSAADTMPERGQLQFETSLHSKLPGLVHCRGEAPRMPCCCLAVTESGCGISPHQLDSIFDPFSPTELMHKGSGLGLYDAKLFVEKHQGAISIEPREGAGTTFRVWLPRADYTEADEAQKLLSRRRHSVLLVGQDSTALESMAEFLRLHHYQVLAVSRQAEQCLQSGEYDFDGVIVQIGPGDRAGHPLVGFVRKHQLPVKVIMQIAGGTQDELETQFLLRADLILTPAMNGEMILEKLRATFDTRRED